MRIHHILVPVDFSRRSVPALAYAVGLARTMGATIDVLHVLPPPSIAVLAFDAYSGRPLPEPSDDALLSARDQMDSLVASVDHTDVLVRQRIVVGDAGAAIVCFAAEHKDELIVVGAHGRSGLADFVIGSVTHTLIASAPCPVLALGPAA